MAALGYCGVEVLRNEIPDRMQVSENEDVPALFHSILNAVIRTEKGRAAGNDDLLQTENADEASVQGTALGQADASAEILADAPEDYTLSYSLFGKVPLKTVEVTVTPRKSVYAGGTPIGIYLKTDGVLVVDTGSITRMDGKECCPAENIVKSGDYIQAVNGTEVTTKEELVECIGQSGGLAVVLDVERAGELIRLRLQPVQNEKGEYKAGIWVRNDTQGIGTLTYVDEDGNFGALGHGISDIDTGEILDVRGGTLYDADVISVIKGQQGSPGELSGIIHYSEGYKIGEIENNSRNGIYGKVSNLPGLVQDKQLYETAHKQEVKTGEAAILCSVDGECREYQIEIKEIRMNGKEVNKGMVLEVTDPELLEKTGGIVQGMSGSPILQNGRIVGAVTHVFVNDPTKGYGIFIENMLEH